MMRVSSTGYNLDNYNSFSEVEAMLSEKKVSYDIADSHLYLFYSETNFVREQSELAKQLIQMDNLVSRFIDDVMAVYSKYNTTLSNLHNEEFTIEYRKMFTEIKKALTDFYEKRGELFVLTHKRFVSVQRMIQKRIKEIDQ